MGFASGNITMRDVEATASGGTTTYGMLNGNCDGGGSCLVYADNSRFKGTTGSVSNGVGYGTFIGGSMLSGTVSNSGTIACGESYEGSYFPLAYSCTASGF